MRLKPLPPALPFRHPAALVATWGGSGLLPGPSGTWGSLATLPVAWAVASLWGAAGLLVAGVAAFVAGLWASGVYLHGGDDKDPSPVVIDETAGQLLTLSVVPLDFWWFAAGFLAFRVMDIAKPFPVNWVDRRCPGALGVMADDVAAAGYAALVLYAVLRLTGA